MARNDYFGLEKDTALELYKLYQGGRQNSFEHHRETLQNYLAFVVTVLGATIAGILQIKDVGWIGAVILVAPILNVSVCVLAIRMCNRYYQAALENTTILVKLESALGLQERVDSTGERQDVAVVFPADRYLFPERWVKRRQYATAEEFVQQHMNAGVNRLVKRTFYLLIAVNVLLGVAIVFALFL